MFYDNSISPGAKMIRQRTKRQGGFYDNSISPGAKMIRQRTKRQGGFFLPYQPPSGDG